jgi:hypothetical protein
MVRKAVDNSLALVFILVCRGSFSRKLPWFLVVKSVKLQGCFLEFDLHGLVTAVRLLPMLGIHIFRKEDVLLFFVLWS